MVPFVMAFVTAVRVIDPFVADLKSALLVWFQVALAFENFGEEAVPPKKP
jgi:hypothetical protein